MSTLVDCAIFNLSGEWLYTNTKLNANNYMTKYHIRKKKDSLVSYYLIFVSISLIMRVKRMKFQNLILTIDLANFYE